MTIYYKRVITWQKWPDNDIKDTDEIHFSTSKKKFDANVFLRLPPSPEWGKSQEAARKALGVKKATFQRLGGRNG